MTPSARRRSCPDTNLVDERFPQAVKLRIHRPKFYAAPLGLSLLSNPTHVSRRGLNNSAPLALAYHNTILIRLRQFAARRSCGHVPQLIVTKATHVAKPDEAGTGQSILDRYHRIRSYVV